MTNFFQANFLSEDDARAFITDAKKTNWLSKTEYSVKRERCNVVKILLKESVATVYMTMLNQLANQHGMLSCEF